MDSYVGDVPTKMIKKKDFMRVGTIMETWKLDVPTKTIKKKVFLNNGIQMDR